MSKFKVLISDPLAKKGVEALRGYPELEVVEKIGLPESELVKIAGEFDAIVVRSETKVNKAVMSVASKLRVVGRAGVGVDNVDVDFATQRGIIVMNAPGGNTISTAELTFSMLMSLARNIPQAHMSMKQGKWNRKAYVGVEIHGKTLGVVGMGRIGSEVAKRAIAFGMKVLAYDPYLALSRAKTLQVELVELDELFRNSDFITVHMPLTDETKGMINADAFSKMKNSVRLLNCARGGIINEKDLEQALKEGRVAGAALDVYEEEPIPADFPLRNFDQVIMTPHLGASTAEAQESVGIEIAHSVADALIRGEIRNAVNMPNIDAKILEVLQPYINFGATMGRMLAQLSPKRIEKLSVSYSGKISELNTNPVTRAMLKGFLEQAGGKEVNQVNAPALAQTLGIRVEENKSASTEDYTELISVSVQTDKETTSLAGTFFGSLNNPRIVRISHVPIECIPSGVLMLISNKDRPGIVGWLGTLLGKHKVNIANMSLSRKEIGGKAYTIFNLDSEPSEEVLNEIQKDPDIFSVKIAKL